MEQSAPSDGDSRSAGKEIPRNLWTRKVYKSPLLVYAEPDESSSYPHILFPKDTL
jgi:hypothetical protein